MKSKICVLGSKTSIYIDIIPDSEDAIAIYVPEKDVILIDSRSQEKFQDFCHELFHLLVHRSGVKQSRSWSEDLEEVLAENFSVMMKENYKDILKLYRKFSKK